jgi:hypothetical protein
MLTGLWLAPDLAVRIVPDRLQASAALDFTFSDFRSLARHPSRADKVDLNRTIIGSAKTIILGLAAL